MTDNYFSFIKKILSTMDSFQQDYGDLRYSMRINSYATEPRIIITIFNKDRTKMIDFAIDYEVEKNSIGNNFIYECFLERTNYFLASEKKERQLQEKLRYGTKNGITYQERVLLGLD